MTKRILRFASPLEKWAMAADTRVMPNPK